MGSYQCLFYIRLKTLLVIKAFHSKTVYKTGCIFPLPVNSPFTMCPIKRQSLFLHLFKLGWPCDLLWPIKYSRSNMWWERWHASSDSTLKRSCTFLLILSWKHAAPCDKSGIACWMKRVTWPSYSHCPSQQPANSQK